MVMTVTGGVTGATGTGRVRTGALAVVLVCGVLGVRVTAGVEDGSTAAGVMGRVAGGKV